MDWSPNEAKFSMKKQNQKEKRNSKNIIFGFEKYFKYSINSDSESKQRKSN